MSAPTPGPRRRRDPVVPYFAGVVVEGLPGGGTLEDAQRIVTERLVRHVARTLPAPLVQPQAAD